MRTRYGQEAEYAGTEGCMTCTHALLAPCSHSSIVDETFGLHVNEFVHCAQCDKVSHRVERHTELFHVIHVALLAYEGACVGVEECSLKIQNPLPPLHSCALTMEDSAGGVHMRAGVRAGVIVRPRTAPQKTICKGYLTVSFPGQHMSTHYQ